MAVRKSGAPEVEPSAPWENPLIPNKKLREIYAAMVELRLLGEHVVTLQRRVKPAARLHTGFGEEGCRVSTSFSELPGDLTSDARHGIAIDFLAGTKLADLLLRASLPSSNLANAGTAPGQLPILEDATARLHLAMGASLGMTSKRGASKKKSSLVVAYLYPGDLTLPQWRTILRSIGTHKAPMFLVVLDGKSSFHAGQLSQISTASGAPGIPVDAADPVALYRVAQESMLRIRAGGGPVLMECIPFRRPGKKTQPADPIVVMQHFLLHRNIVTEAWMQGVATRFKSRIEACAS